MSAGADSILDTFQGAKRGKGWTDLIGAVQAASFLEGVSSSPPEKQRFILTHSFPFTDEADVNADKDICELVSSFQRDVGLLRADVEGAQKAITAYPSARKPNTDTRVAYVLDNISMSLPVVGKIKHSTAGMGQEFPIEQSWVIELTAPPEMLAKFTGIMLEKGWRVGTLRFCKTAHETKYSTRRPPAVSFGPSTNVRVKNSNGPPCEKGGCAVQGGARRTRRHRSRRRKTLRR